MRAGSEDAGLAKRNPFVGNPTSPSNLANRDAGWVHTGAVLILGQRLFSDQPPGIERQ